MGDESKQTFQDINPRQLLVLVRYKPAGLDTTAAEGMFGKISNPIESAVGAIESAAASIPGLNMFITEEKNKSSSEKEYDYFKDYSPWDKLLDKQKKQLQEMNEYNEVEKYEFDATDADGRKKAGKELFDKVKSKWSGWKDYTGWIHFVGLGQGGNVVNECTALMANNSDFKKEKWLVKSVTYIATPHYKNKHVLNISCLKDSGFVSGFANRYDLTQNGIDYFDNTEKILTLITDSNKNVLSLATGKVKLRLVKILAIVLGGLQISAGPDALKDLDKIDQVKNEITGMIDDIMGFLEKLIKEGTSFVNLDAIPDFKNITNGFGDIPGKCASNVTDVITEIKNKAIDGAKQTNLSLGPSDLAGVLNGLCPLFDAISQSLGVLKPGTKGAEDLAKNIIESAGIKEVYAPGSSSDTLVPVDEKYVENAVDAAKKKQPDMAPLLINKVKQLLTKATETTNEISKMTAEQKSFVAEAIGCLTLPMLPTKKDFYAKLVNALPFDLSKLTEDFTADKLTGAAAKPLEGIGIKFPEKLTQSVAGTDAEMKRVKGFFDKNNFKLLEKIDSLYLIFNSHNIALKKVYGPYEQSIDKATMYMDWMTAKGYDNVCTLQENKYSKTTKKEKENAIPAQPVEEEKAA